MSEQASSSAPASEPAQPEPVSPPKKGEKKKLWLMIVAVIVAVLLIGTAVYVLVLSDGGKDKTIGLDIASEILPSDDITIEAGATVELSVTSSLVNVSKDISHDIDEWTNVTYAWTKSPSDLGTYNLVARRTVLLTAAEFGTTGTVTCTVTWSGKSTQVTADVTVNPPFIDSVYITPSTKTLAPEEPWPFAASAIDSVGAQIPGLSYSWAVSGLDSDEYTLNATTGPSVTFTGLVEGDATLTATASSGGVTKTGSASISVGGPPMRTVDYRYYDLFNVPFGEWWDLRKDETVLTNEYPYIFIWWGNTTNPWLYTNQRLELTGRNMPELNMNERPEFLPLFGDVRGGTAEIDWYMQYLTAEEMERYPDATAAWLDGWVIALNGTVTLDKTAAMAVMGITSGEFDDFDSWWSINQYSFIEDYTIWVMDEAGKDRLDIFPMYEYFLNPLTFDMYADKVGDKIVLEYDTVSWGMEALMTRWMKEAFMPVEWYFEDMYFKATIGPEDADIDMDAAAVYAAYAYETTLTGQPCWMWEALMQDYLPSSGTSHPYSLYDVYIDLEYVNYAPGSPWYGTLMPYDYAPGAHNLSENETMVFEWPAGDDLLFYGHAGDNKTFNYTGAMTCDYSEPDWVEFPGQVVLDTSSRTLTFHGPIDFWTWSKYQGEILDTTRYDNLASEWDRLDVLPYGCPTIEFRMWSPDDPVPNAFRVEGITDPIEIGASSDVTVTVLDQTGAVFTTYMGTVVFSSDDPEATLPAAYEFQPADLGTKTFTDAVSFSAAGSYYVLVEDSADPDIYGSQDNIAVFSPVPPPEATSLRVQGVTSPIMEGVSSGFTVTVLDQHGSPFMGTYTGTIRFSSNDTVAELPSDYTFTVLDGGTNTWLATEGVVFHTPGWRDLTAYDIATPSISGSQLEILVTEEPEPTSFRVELSSAEAIANHTWLDVTVTALDQYGDPYPGYVGTVEFSSDDTVADYPTADLEFVAGDLGVKSWPSGVMMGTPGVRTITVEDSTAEMIGSAEVTVTPERAPSYFVITDMAPTVQLNEPETFTVTVYDQYAWVYTDYLGEVTFTTNRTGEVTLPGDYVFQAGDQGTHDFSATFTELGRFTVTVSDKADSSITGQVTNIQVTVDAPVIDHFVVTGISSPMWEDNYSDVVVTAYDQFGGVFVGYTGTVEFSTDAPVGTYALPDPYTFQAADDGVKTFQDAVMFGDGGTYSVTVTDDAGTETGSQTGIVIIDLEPTTLVISGEPVGTVEPGEEFSLTVTVNHQFNEPCYEYEGTVEFTSSDIDAGVVLPDPYVFTLGDAGVRVFTDAFALVTDGAQTITAEDQDDSSLTDTVTVTVHQPPVREATYKLYDFLAEPFGDWWGPRESTYSTDYILSEGTNANAYLYFIENADSKTPPNPDTQGAVYAPYRYNITAKNLTTINAHDPEFLPLRGSESAEGASVQMSLYMQYLTDPWYLGTKTLWTAPGAPAYYGAFPGSSLYVRNNQEGYLLMTSYDVKMNREAALEWVGLPLGEENPLSWYSSVGLAANTYYNDWFHEEGDERLDIAWGYADNYYSLYTMSRLLYDVGTDEVTLQLLHISWGYEVLMDRWLTEAEISSNLEPYYEDLKMNVSYSDDIAHLDMDAVCQYSLHAVEATGTEAGVAWVWEPSHIDYALDADFPSYYVEPKDRPNEYLPYSTLTYESRNTGDNLFGLDATYEYTPYWFNLSENEKLVFDLPSSSVRGYLGQGVSYEDYLDIRLGDISSFTAIETTGTMSLGHHDTGGVDLSSMMSGNTLTIQGPVSFDNTRHTPDGPLYHGAPWIELNVGGTFAALNAEAPAPAEASETASCSSVATTGATPASGLLSMVAVVCAAMVAVAALGAGRKLPC